MAAGFLHFFLASVFAFNIIVHVRVLEAGIGGAGLQGDGLEVMFYKLRINQKWKIVRGKAKKCFNFQFEILGADWAECKDL